MVSVIQRRLGLIRPAGRLDLLACVNDLTIPPPVLEEPEEVSVGWAKQDDLPALAAVMEPYRSELPSFRGGGRRRRGRLTRQATLLEEFQARLAAGDICCIARDHGVLAYMGWTSFTTASLPRLGLELPLIPGEAYSDGVFVLPAYRGRRVAITAGAARLRTLWQMGIRSLYAWVNPKNTAVLRAQDRVNWRRVARVSQFYVTAGRRVPLINRVIFDPADPLAAWCSPRRLHFRHGITLYR